ncbi:hypothetical protein ONZ45_g13815 [Pleurotus djamor]|nr:hypothetical protein ONZ45_g13815 [Pleurotus djamor]
MISPIYQFIGSFISPLVIGTILACPLYGITIAQSVWYYQNYPKDSVYMKGFIAVLLLIDGAQTVGLADGPSSSRNGSSIETSSRGMFLDLYFLTFIVVLAHFAYTYRVWTLSDKNLITTSVLVLLTVTRFAVSLALDITMQIRNNAFQIHDSTGNGIGLAEMSVAVVCDLLIAASMAYYLRRRRSGSPRTVSLVDRLIMHVIGIGLLTSLFVVIILIVWILHPHDLIFMVFHSIMSKLYVNSFLVTLNARHRHRNVLDATAPDMLNHTINSLNLNKSSATLEVSG